MEKSLTEKRVRELYRISYTIRQDIITMVHGAKTGHAAPSMSEADILTALYFEMMNINPQKPKWEERDRFILSKGHASPGLYSVLARRGYFPVNELKTYRALNSRLQGHPVYEKLPGVEMTTGSLGNGFSGALGMALVAKRMNRSYRVFALTGDGELQEGIIWEAAMAAGQYGLDNLTVIVDNNGLQSGGAVKSIMSLEPLDEKFRAFGWDTQTIDGHDMRAICEAVEKAGARNGKPHLIIAQTTKGKGVSFIEGQYLWHMKAPNDEEYTQAMRELKEVQQNYE